MLFEWLFFAYSVRFSATAFPTLFTDFRTSPLLLEAYGFGPFLSTYTSGVGVCNLAGKKNLKK